MMFFGVGLSALLGAPYIGSRIVGLNEIRLPFLSDLPLVGSVVFHYIFSFIWLFLLPY